jgi:aspartate-semialdehyde dehydrogenase
MRSPRTEERIPVAVLGATGSVGQRFVSLLAAHPWFVLDTLCASPRSVDRRYGEAVRWMQSAPLAGTVASKLVQAVTPDALHRCPLVFSALPAAVADEAEKEVAGTGCLVVSNTKSHRMHPRVPLVVPEVNAEHLELLALRPFGDGAILTNPNCSTIGLVLALKPLLDAFGLEAVNVVTLQAASGAGIRGAASLQLLDNLIPHIEGEEQKIESETRKILGKLTPRGIEEHPLRLSAACNRVAVLDGHTECVSVKLGRRAEPYELVEAWRCFRAAPQELELPSAPRVPVHVLEGADQPQPRLHRDLEAGMAVSVGRLRACPVLDYKFVTLSHNTVRGAAGGAILAAELALATGHVPGAARA